MNSERWEPKQKKPFGKIGVQYFRKDGSLGFGEIEAPPEIHFRLFGEQCSNTKKNGRHIFGGKV